MNTDQQRVESHNPTYEQLRTQHQDHERRLAELSQKAWLTPDEELEEKKLKKVKLQLKDRMERMRRSAT